MNFFVDLLFHNCHISLSAGQERMLSAQSALVVVFTLCWEGVDEKSVHLERGT